MARGLAPSMRDTTLFGLRFTLGGYLAAHGAQKLFGAFGGRGLEASAAGFDRIGLAPGRPLATLAATAELAGGLLTAAGLADPLGPVTLAATMAVASSVGHRGKGPFAAKGGFELPLTNLAAAAVLGATGPGRVSGGPAARPAAPAPAGTPDPGRRCRGRGHHDRAQRHHGQAGHRRSGQRRRRGHTADRRRGDGPAAVHHDGGACMT
jgi:putative oxidoreductase